MTQSHERLDSLEPPNLLEPMDLTDTPSVRRDPPGAGGPVAPARLEDRGVLDDRVQTRGLMPRRRGNRRLTLGLLAVGAAACIGAGVAVSELVRSHDAQQRANGGASGPSGASQSAKTQAAGSAGIQTGGTQAAGPQSAGTATGNAPGDGQTPQTAGTRPTAATPCDRQTGPNAAGSDCAKRSGDTDASATRAVSPDHNAVSPPKTTSSAVADVPTPKPANAAEPGAAEQAAAKPSEIDKTATSEPQRRAERSARQDRIRKARRAARIERTQQPAQAGAAAAQPSERTANVDGGDDARSGEDAEQSRRGEQRRVRHSARERRPRYDDGYRDRQIAREAEGRGVDPDSDRHDSNRSYSREDPRSYGRPAPDARRIFVLPGFERSW